MRSSKILSCSLVLACLPDLQSRYKCLYHEGVLWYTLHFLASLVIRSLSLRAVCNKTFRVILVGLAVFHRGPWSITFTIPRFECLNHSASTAFYLLVISFIFFISPIKRLASNAVQLIVARQ